MQYLLRRHIEKRVPLTDDEFALVAARFTVEKVKKHEKLFQAGRYVRHMYFLVSGLTKLVYRNSSGKEHILSFATADWWECDDVAYFNQSRATLSSVCLEDTVVLRLSLAGYRALCTELPKFESFQLQLSMANSIAAQRRLLSFLSADAKERYEQLVEQYPALVQRVPKTQLASYLGVSRETLSRIYR